MSSFSPEEKKILFGEDAILSDEELKILHPAAFESAGTADTAVATEEPEAPPVPTEEEKAKLTSEEIAILYPEQVSQGEAFGIGAAQGATFGFSDEIQGAMGWFQGEDYVDVRDQARRRIEAAQEQWGKTYLGGELTGGAWTMFVPGGAAAKANTILKAAMAAAKVSAVEGALYGLGSSNDTSVEGLISDAFFGGAAGGTVGFAFGGLIHGIPKFYKTLKGKANKVAAEVDDGMSEVVATNAQNAISNNKPTDIMIGANIEKNKELFMNPETWTVRVSDGAKVREIMDQMPPEIADYYRKQASAGTKKALEKVTKKNKEAYSYIHEPGTEVRADDLIAYQMMRQDMVGFMKYADDMTSLDPLKVVKNKHNLTLQRKITPELLDSWAMNVRQGKINTKTFLNYRHQQYLSEAYLDALSTKITAVKLSKTGDLNPEWEKNIKEAVQSMHSADPLGGSAKALKQNMAAVNVAMRMIDDVAPEMQLERAVDDMERTFNKGKVWKINTVSKLDEVERFRQKEGLGFKEIIAEIESGDIKSTSAKLYSEFLDKLREEANTRGAAIPKLEKYVKVSKKRGADFAVALQERAKKNGLYDLKDSEYFGRVLQNLPDIEDLETSGFKNAKQEIYYIVANLNKVYGRKFTRVADIKKALDTLTSTEGIIRSSAQDVGAAYERKGMIPAWLREDNIYKLAVSTIDQMATVQYVQPTAQRLLSKVPLLRARGMHGSAEYVEEYANAMMGIKDANSFVGRIGGAMTRWLEVKEARQVAQTGNSVLGEVRQWITELQNLPYVEHLGFDPTKPARNLLQAFNHTAPHVEGWIKGIPRATKAWAEIIANPRETAQTIKMLKAKGFIPEKFSGEQIDTITDQLMQTKVGRASQMGRKAFRKFAETALWTFAHSDTLNRVATYKIASEVATDMMMSKGILGQTAYNKLPRAFKVAADLSIKEGNLTELTDLLAGHYLSKTQFIYSKAGKHKLARNVPILSMFSKWPTQIGSEIVYSFVRDKGLSAANIYAAPMIASSVAGALVYKSLSNQNKTRYETILGGKGAAAAAQYAAPGSAIMRPESILLGYHPQKILEMVNLSREMIFKGLDGRLEKRDASRVQRKIIQSGYVPGAKSILGTGQKLHKIISGRAKE